MEEEIKFTPEKIKKETVNIGSRGETKTEKMLSNFTHTPFDLDGTHYESVEGF
jgi:predicted NAD-dependent protein-ADP-ribosyltransferase YbiA (DUF1768 family)